MTGTIWISTSSGNSSPLLWNFVHFKKSVESPGQVSNIQRSVQYVSMVLFMLNTIIRNLLIFYCFFPNVCIELQFTPIYQMEDKMFIKLKNIKQLSTSVFLYTQIHQYMKYRFQKANVYSLNFQFQNFSCLRIPFILSLFTCYHKSSFPLEHS